MDWSIVATLVGGLGVGSTISTYLTSGRSRREVKGAVLEKLSSVEAARWAGPSDPVPFSDFIAACRALETAALIARVPRRALLHYLKYAHAARLNSEANWERYGEEEVGGFISNGISEAVRDSAETLTQVVWSPWSRVGLRWRLASDSTKIFRFSDKEDREYIENAQKRLGGL